MTSKDLKNTNAPESSMRTESKIPSTLKILGGWVWGNFVHLHLSKGTCSRKAFQRWLFAPQFYYKYQTYTKDEILLLWDFSFTGIKSLKPTTVHKFLEEIPRMDLIFLFTACWLDSRNTKYDFRQQNWFFRQ